MKTKLSSLAVLVRAMTFALLCLALSGAALAFAAPVGPAPDEVLVRFRAGTSTARRNNEPLPTIATPPFARRIPRHNLDARRRYGRNLATPAAAPRRPAAGPTGSM